MELRKRLINKELREQENEDIKVKELVSKEESDDFQSSTLVRSSDTASEMDVNEVCSHLMLCKTKCVQAVRRG